MKFLKLLITILLFPFGISLFITLFNIITKSFTANYELNNFLYFVGGCTFYFFIYITLPKPHKFYVLGHELTHAFWALLMGKKVSKIKISKKGGYVEISNSNFWISLSPYFFPFYTFVLIIFSLFIYFFLDSYFNKNIFYFLIGVTWIFHILFTIDALKIKQTDITAHGKIFSYFVILFMNILLINLGLILFSGIDILNLALEYHDLTLEVYVKILNFFKKILELLVQFF